MKKDTSSEQNLEDIDKVYERLMKEKEEHLIDLIVEIIVSSTLREYYEEIDARNSPAPDKEGDG